MGIAPSSEPSAYLSHMRNTTSAYQLNAPPEPGAASMFLVSEESAAADDLH
jgi:hypothetical protein